MDDGIVIRTQGTAAQPFHYHVARVPYHRVIRGVAAEESDANAALISSAPDLLDLAHQYTSECARCDGEGLAVIGIEDVIDCPDCADIRAVIAKAEGRA
jgi:hypothetical protein